MMYQIKKLLWFVAVMYCAAGVSASTATSSPNPVRPSITTNNMSAEITTSSVAVIPSNAVGEEGGSKKAFQNRPSNDAGLRYSSNDWLINFISTPTSFILRRIRFHMLTNMFVCLLAIYVHENITPIGMPMTGHSLLGSSLGLLLSYRTNSAYSRFWEARGYWTKTKSTCRNLAIMIKAHIEPHAPKAAEKMSLLLAAFPSALMHLCLGGGARLNDHVQNLIPKESYPEEYTEYPQLPGIYLCVQLQHALHEASDEEKDMKSKNLIAAAHFVEAGHMIDTLMFAMSSCEKILRTPLPWTYSRHTSRFVSLWLITLPFALIENLNKGLTIAITIAASYCMLGIEEIGHLIEQPFLGDAEGEKVWSIIDEDGEVSALIKRGVNTRPYDIGIPVCSLARSVRDEIKRILMGGGTFPGQQH